MKLCESCRYRNNTEYEKPCVVYRDDCEYYEKERGDMTKEEAIKELQESHDIMRSYDIDESESRLMTALDMAIKALEQEPKTGHWIFQKIKYGEHLAPMRMWCSNCNSAFDLCCNQIKRYDEATKKEYLWGHCPWCGARMFEPQESEGKE